MEYANHLNEYAPAWSEAQVAEEVARIREAAKRNHNAEVYKMCYSAIDITTLSCNDSVTFPTWLRSASIRHSSRPSGWPWTALR